MDLLNPVFFLPLHPSLSVALNLLLQSIALAVAFLLMYRLLARQLPAAGRHLFWLGALLGLALLPLLPALGAALSYQPAAGLTFVLEVPAGAGAGVVPDYQGLALPYLYFLPCMLLLARLGVALVRTNRLRRQAVLCRDGRLPALLGHCGLLIGLKRPVQLRISGSIQSPVSFGLWRPQIILPAQAECWPDDVLGDVLLHELSHIRRMDWMSMLFAQLVLSIYWINPLVWLLARRLNEEAENSCDAAVVNAGRSETDYAGSLLSVAKACCGMGRLEKGLAVQSMLEHSTFKLRITQLLEENMMSRLTKKEIRNAAVILTMASAALLVGISSTQIALAQGPSPQGRMVDEEILPLVNVTPMYPTRAAAENVEGWVQLRFTVTETGTVDADSIEVVDAEPAEIFNANSIAAASRFQFSPRIRDGQAVAVPGVEYVFRYEME